MNEQELRKPVKKHDLDPSQLAAKYNDGLAAELDAKAVAEAEARVEFSDDPGILIKSTEQALESLNSYFNQTIGLDSASQYSEIIRQRVRRHLVIEVDEKSEPSRFAQATSKFVATDNVNSEPELRNVLIERQRQLLAEIQPLFRKIIEESPEGKREEVTNRIVSELKAVRVGSANGVHGQMQATLFGVMSELKSRHKDVEFEELNLEAADPVATVTVINPLDAKNQEYIYDRLEAQAEYTERKNLAEFIVRRSDHATSLLEEEAELLAGSIEPEQQRLHQAYTTLAEWIDDQVERLTDEDGTVREIDDTELSYHAHRMHFFMPDANGQTFNGMARILNATEVVKKGNPDLYMNLLGIGSGRDYATQEAGRSALFGSVFHIGLSNSLNYRPPTLAGNRTLAGGVQAIRARMDSLTRLTSSYPDLEMMYRSPEQIAALEEFMDRTTDEFMNDVHGDKSKTVIPVAIALILSNREYEMTALQRTLQEMEVDRRAEIIDKLATAGPSEFMAAVRNLPEYMVEDEDVQEAVRARLKMTDAEMNNRHAKAEVIRKLVQGPKHKPAYATINLIEGLRANQIDMTTKARRYEGQFLKLMLWETAPREKVLSEAFYDELVEAEKRIRKIETTEGIKNEEARMIMEQLLYAVTAHPDISEQEWKQWYEEIGETQAPLLPIYKGMAEISALGKRERVLKACFRHITPSMIEAAGSTRFLTLQDELFEKPNAKDGEDAAREMMEAAEESIGSKEGKYPSYGGPRSGYSSLIKPHLVAAARLRGDDYRAEKELLDNSLRRAKVEFRTTRTEKFWHRFISVIYSDSGGVFTDLHLRKVINSLNPDESKLLLTSFFEHRQNQYLRNTFNPDSPWQIELLQQAEALIPDDENYRAMKKIIAEKRIVKIPREPEREHSYTGFNEPCWGKPKVNPNDGTISFRTEDDNIKTYRFEISRPRYVQDEHGAWHAEAYNRETEEWERVPLWRRLKVVQETEMHKGPVGAIARLDEKIFISHDGILGNPMKVWNADTMEVEREISTYDDVGQQFPIHTVAEVTIQGQIPSYIANRWNQNDSDKYSIQLPDDTVLTVNADNLDVYDGTIKKDFNIDIESLNKGSFRPRISALAVNRQRNEFAGLYVKLGEHSII